MVKQKYPDHLSADSSFVEIHSTIVVQTIIYLVTGYPGRRQIYIPFKIDLQYLNSAEEKFNQGPRMKNSTNILLLTTAAYV